MLIVFLDLLYIQPMRDCNCGTTISFFDGVDKAGAILARFRSDIGQLPISQQTRWPTAKVEQKFSSLLCSAVKSVGLRPHFCARDAQESPATTDLLLQVPSGFPDGIGSGRAAAEQQTV